MELQEFLSLVTPDEGVRYVTLIQQKTNKNQKYNHVSNQPYSSINEGIEIIEAANQIKDFNVYFSCASYAQAEYTNAKGKKKTRTSENATHARAIWRDLDVGEGKPNAYPSQDAAVDAIVSLCGQLKLPIPLTISSGNGIHAYWPFTRNVTKAEWLRLAAMAADVFPRLGLLSDSSRDCDIASVLRPIGTANKGKYVGDPASKVELVCKHQHFLNPDSLAAVLSPHVVSDPLNAVPSWMKSGGVTEELAKQREYPPSYADIVAEKCAQIADFRNTGGSSYIQWLLGMAVIKHTVEGEAKAHEWAAKHEEYAEGETQEKLDSLDGGPPICKTYGNEGKHCTSCRFFGKVRSPITLGYKEETEPEVVAVPTEEDGDAKAYLPEGYAIRNDIVCVREVKDEIVTYPEITKTLFWFEGRHWDTAGQIIIDVICRVRKGKDGVWQYRHFDLPAGTVGKGGAELYGALGQNEIYSVSKKGAKQRMDALAAAMAEDLKQRKAETTAHRVFGWQADGGFLIGDQKHTHEGQHRAKVTGDSAPTFLSAFAKNGGSAETWCELVEALYSHANHATFQTVTLFGIGSPLLKYYQMPTGCLVNMVGDRGTGKTTAARVGLSAYGDPNGLMTEFRSTTELALYNRLATLHSIPCSVDELTNVEPLKASTMIYSMMNGQPRDGMRSDGKRRDQLVPWQTVTFASANESIVELLAAFKGNASAEISRLIELDWAKVKTIDRREADKILDAMRDHHGAMGTKFVQWVLQNERKAERTLLKMREFIEDELKIDKENRYWSAHIAVPLATKLILERMGLLDTFHFDDIMGLCLATIREHKSSMNDLTMNSTEAFHAMLTHLSDKIITTRGLKDTRFATPDGVIMNGEPLGRAILDDNDLYLSVAGVREWCSVKRISYKAMRKELVALETLRGDVRFYIGRGTTRLTGQTYCWHLDLSRVLGISSVQAQPTDNGHLKLVKT